jgi:hypothetical protein
MGKKNIPVDSIKSSLFEAEEERVEFCALKDSKDIEILQINEAYKRNG